MPSPARLLGQAVCLLALMALIGLFSSWPVYQRLPADQAQIKLAFSHGAPRIEECRRLTSDEIAALPPRERRVMDCARERNPVRIQLELDGRLVIDRQLSPTGLSSDGPARIYEIMRVPVGPHRLAMRLDDRGSGSDFAYFDQHTIELGPRQNLTIDFRIDRGGFVVE